jgi:hypothetical protein
VSVPVESGLGSPAATLQPIRPDDPRFSSCGTLLLPQDDPSAFGPQDAELHFDADGHPRFYLMRLRRRPPVLAAMTSHQRVSQCLGSADAQAWWLAVAPPGPPRPDGSIASDQVLLVKMLPGEGVKLHPGTWHAGPFLNTASALFFNLELRTTNEDDHNCRSVDQPRPLALI